MTTQIAGLPWNSPPRTAAPAQQPVAQPASPIQQAAATAAAFGNSNVANDAASIDAILAGMGDGDSFDRLPNPQPGTYPRLLVTGTKLVRSSDPLKAGATFFIASLKVAEAAQPYTGKAVSAKSARPHPDNGAAPHGPGTEFSWVIDTRKAVAAGLIKKFLASAFGTAPGEIVP